LRGSRFLCVYRGVMIKKSLGLLSSFLLSLLVVGCSPKPKTAEAPTPQPQAEASVPAATPAPATPAPPAEPTLPKTIRIVAWNLEWFPGHKPDPSPDAETLHMEVAKAALAELNPAVLLLEEVRDWASAEELCKAVPGLQVQVTSKFEPRPQNQVVASKFPADSGWSEVWHPDIVSPPRGYAFAAIELPGQHFLLTYALHLKSNLGDLPNDIAMREASTKQLLEHVPEMVQLYGRRAHVAVVVGGDLNTSLDDPAFSSDHTLSALKAAGFHWTHEGVAFASRTTIPGKGGFPDNCFDHIFTAGLGTPTAEVKPYVGISDHNPVVLDVDLSQADFKPKIEPAPGVALLKEIVVPPAPVVAETLDANNLDALKAAVGKVAAVKGQVQKVSSTSNKSIYFIDFAGNRRGGFVGIVRQDKYDAVAAAFGGDLSALAGKTVQIRGPITVFKDAPQIVVNSPDQIKVE
jgi:endonuclease/exonuclease/phosphatase family metal-dependent hydrolase